MDVSLAYSCARPDFHPNVNFRLNTSNTSHTSTTHLSTVDARSPRTRRRYLAYPTQISEFLELMEHIHASHLGFGTRPDSRRILCQGQPRSDPVRQAFCVPNGRIAPSKRLQIGILGRISLFAPNKRIIEYDGRILGSRSTDRVSRWFLPACYREPHLRPPAPMPS